jgi:uncharacterized protein (UPF0335 family)
MIWTRATITPLLRWLSTKHNSIDLAKKAFPCKRIEEHKQESISVQSEIADVYDAKISIGFKLWSLKD